MPELDSPAPLSRAESKSIEKPLPASNVKEAHPAETQQTEEQSSPVIASETSEQAETPVQVEASPEPELSATQQVAAYASWEETLEAYGRVRAGVAALLEHVVCLSFGDKVRLALDTHQERAIVSAERLSFAEWLGREVHWEPKADQQGESVSVQRTRQAEARQQQLEKTAEDDPHVQALKQAFDGKIEAVRAPGAAGGDDIPLEEEAT